MVTAASEQLDSMEPYCTRLTSILGSLHGHFVESSLDSSTWLVHFATVHFISLVPRPIPSFSMLHTEKREEGLVCEFT